MDINQDNFELKSYCDELKKKIKLNKKILLVNPPQFNLDNFEVEVGKNRGYYAYPPTGLLSLVHALKDRGLDIEIFDLNYEFLKKSNFKRDFDPKKWMDIFKEKINSNDYSIVGISNFFYVDADYIVKIGEYLMNKGEVIVIAGGHNATYNSEKFLKDKLCHFVLERESENKINFLFDFFYEDKKSTPTPGIVFIYNGNIKKSKGEKDIVLLKGNLIDEYEKIPVEEYCKVGSLSPYSRMAGLDTPFTGILFNRGCRGNCKFCDVGDFMGKTLRSRDVKDFLDEMEYLVKKRKIGFFEFLDDDFTRDKKLALEVMKGMIERNIKIKWASNNGFIASTLDEELMKGLRDSGCIGFKIGVESGNSEFLRDIRKPGTLETFIRFSNVAQNFPEIFIVDNYIIGFPNETLRNIKNSLKFSFQMNLDWSSFALYQQNVSSLDDKERDISEIEDFIPTKDFHEGKIKATVEEKDGMEIFNILEDNIPTRAQIKHIWFTYTIIRNYIYNKNLLATGNPDKFILWTETIEERYPTHPYINLYLALAYNLVGKTIEAKKQYEKMMIKYEDVYWNRKMKLFKFDKVIENFPDNIEKTREAIEFLRKENDWR